MRLLYSLTTAASLAFASIRAHKLRSFLTLLGVIIGVCSVVIVGAAIDGLGTYAEQTTAKTLGSNSYQIGQLLQLGRMSRKERYEKLKYNKRIRPEDYTFLKETTGDRILYSPYRVRSADVKHGTQLLESVSIIGVAASMAEIREVDLTEGRFFTEQEERNRVPVAVIGEDLRTEFFPGVTPLGKEIKVAGFDLTVVGVQEKIGSGGGNGQSQDSVVYLPSTVYNRIFGPDQSLLVFAKAKPGEGLSLDQALDLTRVALRNHYKTRPGKPDNFDTLTPDSIREFIGNIIGLISAAVVPITAISLVVGGIVIMNIMLVSVTERTKEIGLRKSLGARHSDLMLQFLMEAVFLSAFGGGVGLALGWAIAKIASIFAGFPLSVSPFYVFLSLFVSSAVGVVSGWYPAARAARMDPVEALRAE
jgi:putative ABC transport system permease protein